MSYDNHQEETRRASDSLRRSRDKARAKKEMRKKLMIRRTIIVAVGALIVFVVIFLLVTICKAIFGGNKDNSNSQVETKKIYSLADATEAPTDNGVAQFPEGDKNNAKTFMTPDIKDDGSSTGTLSENDSNLYIYNNMALELFSGSDSSAVNYAKSISDFKKSAPEYTVYNMLVPTHTEFALPTRLTQDGSVTTSPQSNYIKKVYESYTEEVNPINCYNYLAEHLSEYLYYNTDRTWTGLGAYYAYQAFCTQTGQTALDIATCTEKTIADFEGVYAGYDEALASNLDTVHYWLMPFTTRATRVAETGGETEQVGLYDETAAGSLANNVFIYGDSSLFVAYNDAQTDGKKIAVVKDSSGNAFVPYLTNNYKEVHVIDASLWKGNLKSYMQDNAITEVLFLTGVSNADSSDYLTQGLLAVTGLSGTSTQTATQSTDNPDAANDAQDTDQGADTDDGGEEEVQDDGGEEAEEEVEEDGGEEAEDGGGEEQQDNGEEAAE